MLRSKSLLLMTDTVLPEYIYYAFTCVVIFYLYMHVYRSYCVRVCACIYIHVVRVHVVQLNSLNILDLILIPVLGRYHFSAIINACRSIKLIKIFKYTRCMYMCINVHTCTCDIHIHMDMQYYTCISTHTLYTYNYVHSISHRY